MVVRSARPGSADSRHDEERTRAFRHARTPSRFGSSRQEADGPTNGHNRRVSGVALPDDVVTLLSSDARIGGVELTGSRARGTVTALSDWDFAVSTADFEAIQDALQSLTAPLRPVIAQWDRLSRNWCYMLILAGPAKVDLIFDQPYPIASPWLVSAATLAAIDITSGTRPCGWAPSNSPAGTLW
jgi:hypothetical protein